jgi:hypothetical protein
MAGRKLAVQSSGGVMRPIVKSRDVRAGLQDGAGAGSMTGPSLFRRPRVVASGAPRAGFWHRF